MAHYTSPPAAYLFDMDGLLLDTERVCLDAFVPLAAARGHDAEDAHAFFLTLIGSSEAMTQDRVTDLMGSTQEGARFLSEWRDVVQHKLSTHVPLRPTVSKTLAGLRAQGARMAVVTSTRGDAARHHLHVAGLIACFETVIGGDEVHANKPDPAPYLQAAAALDVDPTHCAAFEDSDRGIMAAVRAGCRAVQIPDLRAPDLALPDLGQHIAHDLWTAAHLVSDAASRLSAD